jgi:hypothetical protein
MAIAQTPTLLSIDQFAEIMGVSPLSINQLDIADLGDDSESDCEVWYQWPYQKNQTLTREVLAQAIADAEEMIARELGYWPAPHWLENEKISYPRPSQARYWNIWYNERWKLKSVQTRYGKLIATGVRNYGEIDTDAAVTLSDTDGDGEVDWFSAGPVPTGVTDVAEIGVYFREADRPDSWVADEEAWRIRPIKVTISGGNVTVEGSLWKLVKPVLQIDPIPEALDPTDTANVFVDGIMIQRVYNDTTTQGTLYLEHVACYGSQCGLLEVDACFGERDREMGYILPEATEADYPLGAPDCCSFDCCYAPDFLTVDYYSGYPYRNHNDMIRMDHLHAQMVARLAVTLLSDESCVECSETQIDYWRAPILDDHENASVPFADDANPFGHRRGALWTWHRVQEMNAKERVTAIR